jgi:hypothetical protein
MDVDLPEPFDSQYKHILQKFADIKDTYAYYNDARLPQDNQYVTEILQFLLDVLNHMEVYYDKLEIDQWALFLNGLVGDFEYGDEQDLQNYLEFEGIDLVSNLLKFDAEDPPDILRITSMRKKLEKALPKFQ